MAASKIFHSLPSTYEQSAWSVKRVRTDNSEKLVDYIVLAEFDIDTGSTVRHQYPCAITGYKEDWFAENMLPEGAHKHEQDWTYMFLNRMEKQLDEDFYIYPSSVEQNACDDPNKRFLYGINLVRNKADSSVRRGAVVKAMALFSRYHFCEIFRQPLVLALDKYYSNPSIDVLEELYNCLNDLSLQNCPRPTIIEQSLMCRGISASAPVSCLSSECSSACNSDYVLRDYTPSRWVNSLSVSLFNKEVPLNISLHTSPDDIGVANLSYFLKIFRESSMKIFNGVLTKKRVLFVGYDHAAGDVCQMVLSAVSMVAPPLANVIKRAFPYANLSDLSFLEVDGFIAGVTNPMFQQHSEWWDLLCVLDLSNGRGTVQTAEEVRVEEAAQKGKQYVPTPRPASESAHEGMDAKFIARVLSGLEAHLCEDWVKLQFHEYTQDILLQALDSKHNDLIGYSGGNSSSIRLSESVHKSMEANSHRVNILRNESEFKALPGNPWTWCSSDGGESDSEKVDGEVLLSQLRRLQIEQDLDDMEVEAIFSLLDRGLVSEISLQCALYLLPVSQGSIQTIACGLLHRNSRVRNYTVRILKRFEKYPSTAPAFTALNTFYKSALTRQIQLMSVDAYST